MYRKKIVNIGQGKLVKKSDFGDWKTWFTLCPRSSERRPQSAPTGLVFADIAERDINVSSPGIE